MAMSSSWSSAAVSDCPADVSLRVRLPTRILFCVRVPVLSVQMTVTAPIVSEAWSLRTRTFDFSMRRMLRARVKVTAMGNPSGTAITISVTAIMK